MEEIVVICVVNVIKEFFVIRKKDGVFWDVFQVMKEIIVIKVNIFFCGLDNVYNNQLKFLEFNY